MPLVSILIPCRNAATTLKETLESALAQVDVEMEIIVVDDGSTDGSLAIAKSYEPRGVRVIEGPRINASAARNRALETSSGNYIQYLDADDLLGADKIRKQIEVLKKHPGCVATARWGRFRKSVSDTVFANDDQLRDWSPVEWLVYHCGKHQMMHPAAWLLSRAVAEKAGPWDERLTLNDDGEYFARVVGVSLGLKYVAGATSYYRTVSAPTLSKSRSRKAFESFYCSLAGTIDVMLGLESSDRTRAAAADMLQRFVYEVYPAVRRERVLAASRIKDLGGSTLRPDFGPQGELISRFLGWRPAILLTRLSRKKRLF
jgi:glycosyltransferase involved in cell wall biosynthesis